MGVDLCGLQRGVPQQLLDHPQIRTTFKQMRCGSMAQPVRGKASSAGDLRSLFYHAADLPLVDTRAASADKHRISVAG